MNGYISWKTSSVSELGLTQTVSLFSESEPIDPNEKMASVEVGPKVTGKCPSCGETVNIIPEEPKPESFGKAFERCDVESMRHFLQQGDVDLNQQYRPHQNTYLHMACFNNESEIVSLLLEYGADPTIGNRFESTPLHTAAGMDSFACLRVLLSDAYKHKVDIDATTDIGQTALYLACQQHKKRIVRFLLEKGANPNIPMSEEFGGETPLHFVSKMTYRYLVYLLLEYGADPNITNTKGESSLWIIVRTCAVFSNCEEILRRFLQNGADIDQRGKYGNTVMHLACGAYDVDLVRFLLENGAKPNEKNDEDETPLDNARRALDAFQDDEEAVDAANRCIELIEAQL